MTRKDARRQCVHAHRGRGHQNTGGQQRRGAPWSRQEHRGKKRDVDEDALEGEQRLRCARRPQHGKQRPQRECRERTNREQLEPPEREAFANEHREHGDEDEHQRGPTPLGREVAAVHSRRESDGAKHEGKRPPLL